MITFKIKAPLWTGNIDSKSDTLQSTGFMGSLRWWTEATLRGMDEFVCDPIGEHSCPLKIKRNNKEINQYCSVCLIFGATGIRRMFKLHTIGGIKVFDGRPINIKPSGRNRGWYLGSGLLGNINLDIISLNIDFEENLILIPLTIAAKWGGIGAKTQQGYGVIELDPSGINFQKFKEAIRIVVDEERLQKLKLEKRNGTNTSLPSLQDMFFSKVQFESDNDWWKECDGIKNLVKDNRMKNWVKSNSIPIAPTIKNWLRYGEGQNLWMQKNQCNKQEIEKWLLGSIGNYKSASRINISCAYHIKYNIWEFRIWGWIPKNDLPNGFDRDYFLNSLEKTLDRNGSIIIPWKNLLGNKTKNHKLKIWREFASPRDTAKPNENDIENYLQDLLGNEEGRL